MHASVSHASMSHHTSMQSESRNICCLTYSDVQVMHASCSAAVCHQVGPILFVFKPSMCDDTSRTHQMSHEIVTTTQTLVLQLIICL